MVDRKRSENSPTAKKAGDAALDPGRWRQKRGISLDEVVEKTKICLRYLKAIESGRFEELPAGIFALSYLRQYADAISYDSARLIQIYEDKMNLKPAILEVRKAPASELRTIFSRLFRAPS